ncbi:MAG: trypsin-like peptidase domain-containing protein [Candidatus Hydrogenedens sp.]|jgi:hypothetical protein|nr:trypsin-like peptidase domain-containing protein [Candidatus Hydrogenedens sp.]
MMKSLNRLTVVTGLIVFVSMTFSLHADEDGVLGRQVFEARKDSVVTLRTVVGLNFGGGEVENEQEANATLISPEGLAVLALTGVDPAQMISGLSMGGDDISSRIISMRMILADGSEKPAEVILRDKDLDLALVRLTEKPEEALPFVDLAEAGAPEILDNVVCLMQYGRVARRSHAAFIDRVELIVTRPRLFYALGDHRSRQTVCSPVFTLQNKLVGVGVMRLLAGDGDRSSDDMMVIIIPAAQIQELVDQLPAE